MGDRLDPDAQACLTDAGVRAPERVLRGDAGTQAATSRDRSILTDRAVTCTSEGLSGGTACFYRGVIVPENPDRQKGQVTEADFIRDLAVSLVASTDPIAGYGSPNDSRVAAMAIILDRLFGLIVPPGGRLEPLVRTTLGLPTDLDVYVEPEVMIRRVISELLPSASFLARSIGLGVVVDKAQEEDRRVGGYRPLDQSDTNDLILGAGGVWWFPGGNGPPQNVHPKLFFAEVGKEVHRVIQAHYYIDHRTDLLLFEDFLVCGDIKLTNIRKAGTWAAFSEELASLYAALMLTRPGMDTSTGLTKRPDILNVDLEHLGVGSVLYEIKTVKEKKKGLKQLAEYEQRLKGVLFKLRRADKEKGDWVPCPVYYAGNNLVVLVWVDQPGLIVYRRYSIEDEDLVKWMRQKRRISHDDDVGLGKIYQAINNKPAESSIVPVLVVGLMLVLTFGLGGAAVEGAEGAEIIELMKIIEEIAKKAA